jgi:hypothetical protein
MNIAGSLRIVERGDPFTRREWREMCESRAFGVFLRRLDGMIEAERTACEKAPDLDAWRKAQGALERLRVVRGLPQIIEGELLGDRKGAGKA